MSRLQLFNIKMWQNELPEIFSFQKNITDDSAELFQVYETNILSILVTACDWLLDSAWCFNQVAIAKLVTVAAIQNPI